MDQPSPDRSAIAESRFDAQTRAAIRPLISPELIAEHQRDPLANHSDALQRVQNYLRRSRAITPYVIVCTQPFREWRIAKLSGNRGVAPEILETPVFTSQAAAMHGLFLKRLDEAFAD